MESESQTSSNAALVAAAGAGDLARVKEALAAGAAIDATVDAELGNNALCAAASGGHVDVVTYLIEHGADIHAEGYCDMTPLHLAARDGRQRVVELLIARGAPESERVMNDILNVAAMSVSGTDAICDVLRQRLLEMARPADGDSHETSATDRLIAAAERGDVAAVRSAIAGGADVNGRDSRGMEALSWAALRGHEPVVAALLDAGAAIDGPNGSGWPPIGQACGQGRLEVVRTLIARGADVNQVFQERTALMCAAYQGHEEVVAAMLEAGADPEPSFDGQTAHSLATMRGHRGIVELIEASRRR